MGGCSPCPGERSLHHPEKALPRGPAGPHQPSALELASQEKERLEDKQREARKERAREEAEWETRWFHRAKNPHTGALDWLYKGGYFERNFSRCPDIY